MEFGNDILREDIVKVLPRLRRFAYSLTSNYDDADDLVQRVVEKILNGRVSEGADLLRWCYRVCKNLWVDEIRFRDVRRRAVEEGWLPTPEAVNGEAEMIGWLDANKIRRVMDELPEGQRLTVSLVSIEGLTYAEAAEFMEVPVGTVMSRLNRARQELYKRLTARKIAIGE